MGGMRVRVRMSLPVLVLNNAQLCVLAYFQLGNQIHYVPSSEVTRRLCVHKTHTPVHPHAHDAPGVDTYTSDWARHMRSTPFILWLTGMVLGSGCGSRA